MTSRKESGIIDEAIDRLSSDPSGKKGIGKKGIGGPGFEPNGNLHWCMHRHTPRRCMLSKHWASSLSSILIASSRGRPGVDERGGRGTGICWHALKDAWRPSSLTSTAKRLERSILHYFALELALVCQALKF